MKILVACEESQAVTIELRRLGHEAYSCDIQECSGGHPEWHIMQDALKIINPEWYDGRFGITPSISFYTMNGDYHQFDGKWDMIIAFPPCTDLAVSGARHFAKKRADGRQQASIDFFMKFANAHCDMIAIENPVGIMSTRFRKPDQIINPYQFGHPETKKTCLWLKNLQPLEETENVYAYMMTLPEKERSRIHWMGSGHAKERSKTYPGIARAMAEQWAGPVEAALKGGESDA